MTSTAAPISAAAEQENENNDNQNQFHGISPLMAAASSRLPKHQRRLQSIVPDIAHNPTVSNFAQPSKVQ
jgi:hypothetical protein